MWTCQAPVAEMLHVMTRVPGAPARWAEIPGAHRAFVDRVHWARVALRTAALPFV